MTRKSWPPAVAIFIAVSCILAFHPLPGNSANKVDREGKQDPFEAPFKKHKKGRKLVVVPSNLPVSLESARTLYKARKLAECISMTTELIARDKNNFPAHWLRGESYYRMEDFQHAMTDLDIAVANWPSVPGTVYRTRGLCDCQLGKFESAIKDFTIFLQKKPNAALGYRERGSTYAELHQYDKAVADATKSVEMEPDYNSYAVRARICLEGGKYKMAAADFTETIKFRPDVARNYQFRSQAYEKLGQKDLAAKDRAKALELSKQAL